MTAILIRELIEDSIAIQQEIQMRHHPDSHEWQVASAEIHRLAAMLTGEEPGAALGSLRKTRKGWPKGTPRKPKVVVEPEVDEDNPHGARCAACGELLCGDPLICIDCDDDKNFGDACEAFYKGRAQ